jgi:hypothetical protein
MPGDEDDVRMTGPRLNFAAFGVHNGRKDVTPDVLK